jgi:multidrug efflux pump subunit AcrA (membrane-fusion protein)
LTGNIRLRGVVPNQQPVLGPGFFARVRLSIGRMHKALLVSERALDTDQGQKVLYVVNDKNEVVVRPLRLGAIHNGLREIADGLSPGERVVINGLQQVRPGVAVEAKLVDMPISAAKNSNRTARLVKASP